MANFKVLAKNVDMFTDLTRDATGTYLRFDRIDFCHQPRTGELIITVWHRGKAISSLVTRREDICDPDDTLTITTECLKGLTPVTVS